MSSWEYVDEERLYMVSDQGQVMNVKSGRVLKPIWTGKKRKQYATVVLHGKNCKIHLLVLEAFDGPRPEGMLGMHLDDDTHNNTMDNLAWGTHEENAQIASLLGNRKDQKLLSECKGRVRDMIACGVRNCNIARWFDVSQQLICDVRAGRTK